MSDLAPTESAHCMNSEPVNKLDERLPNSLTEAIYSILDGLYLLADAQRMIGKECNLPPLPPLPEPYPVGRMQVKDASQD